MKLFYLLALEGLNAKRVPVSGECDRYNLPDIPHAEWTCYINGVETTSQYPDECDSICNPGFVHDYFGKTFSRCHKNPRKERYQWYPKKGFSNCIPELASTCDVVPDSEDLTFFLLNNEISQGSDGYSDDEPAEPLAMFSGTIPISPLLDPSTKWTMFINFGHNDPNVDISGVDFTSVNAVVVYQDMKHLILRHREYNGDISLVSKIDLQGRSEDPTEAHKLGSFSQDFLLTALSHLEYSGPKY